jgi:hypothetical protein
MIAYDVWAPDPSGYQAAGQQPREWNQIDVAPPLACDGTHPRSTIVGSLAEPQLWLMTST